MVFFCCNKCGSSLKKAQVEKHVFQCRPQSFSCMDCHKDFRGDDYKGHTKCISEEEKYGGDGFKAPPNRNKGEKKQQAWVEIVQATMESAGKFLQPAARNLLQALTKHENVPRKKPKFLNFVRNIGRNRFDEQTLNMVWDLLEKQWKSTAEQNKPQQQEGKSSKVDAGENSAAEKEASAADEAVEESKTEKKKKGKKKGVEASETSVSESLDQSVENPEEEQEGGSKKKKKKSKKEKSAVEEERNETTEQSPKKKNKKENGLREDVSTSVDAINNGVDTTESKKKKSKKHSIEDESLVANEADMDITPETVADTENGERQKKKKKRKHTEDDATTASELENSVQDADVKPKKKHKREKNSVESNGLTLVENNSVENGDAHSENHSMESPEDIKKRLKAERKAAKKAAKAAAQGL